MKNKILILIIIVICLSQITFADNVGVTFTFPDGSVYGECVKVSKNIDAYELLKKTRIDLLFAGPGSFGHQLCKANGIGDDVSANSCSYSGKYWGFFSGSSERWSYMPVGFDAGDECWNNDLTSYDGHYCAKEGDTLGFRYGEFGDLPQYFSFDDVCQSLILDPIKIYLNGKSQKELNSDGDVIKVTPNSTLKFKIKLSNENLFSYDSIEDIEVEITIKDIENGNDIKRSVEFSDIDSGERESEELEFFIPLNIEDKDYKIKFELSAETNSGISQDINRDYKLKIDKKKHNLVFFNLELRNNELCGGDLGKILITIINIGKSDEKDLKLIINNDEIGLSKAFLFDLESGDFKKSTTFEKEIDFTVPIDTKPGNYLIVVKLLSDNSLKTSVNLNVNECDNQKQIKQFKVDASKILEIKQVFKQQNELVVLTNLTHFSYDKSFVEKNLIYMVLLAVQIMVFALIISIILILRK